MKIKIAKSVLLEPLMSAARAVSSKNVIEIIKGVLFEVEPSGIRLTGTDLNIRIETEIGADSFQFFRPGAVVIDAGRFTEIIKKMPNEDIDIEVIDLTCQFKVGKTVVRVNGMQPEQYPVINFDGSAETVTFESDVLKRLIGQVIYAASDDLKNPIFTGVKVEIFKEAMLLTSSDRNRIVKVKEKISLDKNHGIQALIPARSLAEIQFRDKTVDVRFNSSWVKFEQSGFTFHARMLDGNFPPLTQFNNKDPVCKVLLAKADFSQALSRALITSETTALKIDVEAEEITITSHSEYGKTEDYVPVKKFDGSPFTLGINAKYVLETMKTIDHELVELNFFVRGQTKFIMFNAIDNDHEFHFISPLLFRDEHGRAV